METVNELTVQKAKNGDSSAFAELYALFADDLYHFALYYLGSSADAEDAVQTAVLTAYRSLPSLKKNAAFRSWLFKILSNCCKDTLKKRSRTQNYIPLEDVEHTVNDTAPPPSDGGELENALLKLSEIDRNIILLSVIGGYKSEEIAQTVHMRPGSVRSRQSRAMQKLKKALE